MDSLPSRSLTKLPFECSAEDVVVCLSRLHHRNLHAGQLSAQCLAQTFCTFSFTYSGWPIEEQHDQSLPAHAAKPIEQKGDLVFALPLPEYGIIHLVMYHLDDLLVDNLSVPVSSVKKVDTGQLLDQL